MKRKILHLGQLFSFLFLLTGAVIHVQAQDNPVYLQVYALSGTRSFALDEIQKITFADENVNIHSVNGSTAELDFSNVSKLAFGSEFISNEPAPIDYGVKVYPNGNGGIMIESVTEISTVNLFDLQGRLLRSIAPKALSATLNLPASSSGIYVVQTLTQQGVSAHKIVVR